MKHLLFFLSALCFCISTWGQEIQVYGSRKAVRTSGDIGAVLLPVAGLTAILVNKDWQGLKQGVFAGITTLGVTYALKYAVKKERPDRSDMHSFPSMHTSVSFTAASFIQRRIVHPTPVRMEMGNPGLCRVHLCGMEPCIREET